LEEEEGISIFADGFERDEAEVGEKKEVGIAAVFQSDSYILENLKDFI
jgi:hypothetical protein